MDSEKSFKNKNLLVIVFEIIVIILGVGGITFATSKLLNDKTQTEVKAGEYNIDYVGDKEISFKEIEPMDDKLINIDTKDNVIRIEFSLRGVSTNKDDKLIYDIMLNEMNIDCSLLNEYTKWNLYKNGKLLSNGSLSPSFDGNVLGDNMRLTNIQEDLPKYNKDYDKYVLIFWISESCDNLLTCEKIDQSSIANSKMSMKVFVALYGGAKKKFERVPNYDNTCANKPILYNNMIAVNYKGGDWYVADKDNKDKNNLWYSYSDKKWANAVVVKNNKYNNTGMLVDKNDILGYYVWIPRYKYKTWNVEDSVNDTYKAYDEGIDIIFENGVNKVNVDSYKNDQYITHPAFGDNLTGFWISKYEISKNDDGYVSKSDIESYRNDTLDNYKNIINNLTNDYALGDKASSMIVNNLEWGSVLYLSHSKYGVCDGDGCSSIGNNDTYKAGNNKQDTTTRNVYGVYDMSGGAQEYVIGNYKIGSATYEVKLSNGATWYNGSGMSYDREYLLRGGMNNGLFYFGDLGFSLIDMSTRSVIKNK